MKFFVPNLVLALLVLLAISSQTQTKPGSTPTRPDKASQIGPITGASNPFPSAAQSSGSSPLGSALNEKQIWQRESPAIVEIITLDDKGEPVALGSGFIVRASGVIVTNFHVMKGARRAQVQLQDGEVFEVVSILDYDESRDLAVAYIRAANLPTVTLGDSDSVETGDHVVAIGNPKGFERTVSAGLVSARRILEGTEKIQISVPISPGSSGGPLYNDRGEVIGVTTEGYMSGAQNLNFAIPFKYAKPMIDSPMRNLALADFGARTARPPRAAAPAAESEPEAHVDGSGAESEPDDDSAGTYTDPRGRFTLQLQPGWRTVKTENDAYSAQKGQSVLAVAMSSSRDTKKLCDDASKIVKKQFNDVHSVGSALKGHGYRGQLFTAVTDNGENVVVLVGGVALRSGGAVFFGLLANGSSKEELVEVAAMVDSLR